MVLQRAGPCHNLSGKTDGKSSRVNHFQVDFSEEFLGFVIVLMIFRVVPLDSSSSNNQIGIIFFGNFIQDFHAFETLINQGVQSNAFFFQLPK